MCMLLRGIGVGEFPGNILQDQEGPFFLAKNQQVSMRTKHIDIRYHFIRDLMESGILILEYVSTEDNYADIMTKNTTANVLNKLFMTGIQVGNIVTKRENV